MKDYPSDAVALLFTLFMAAVFASTAFFLLVYAPRSAYVQAKCLAAGYPISDVSWNLQGYCIKLDGSTFSVVDVVP